MRHKTPHGARFWNNLIKHLYIKNYALIDELDIDFSSGFSVITGETGAGKSIILGAIGLLLGQRADSKAVKTGVQKCTIEACFDISRYNLTPWFDENELDVEDSGECFIRRELTSAGKSRGFINDTPVTVQQMKELGEMLVDIHSQHQNLLLQKEDFQLNVLDIMARNGKLLSEYKSAFAEYRNMQHEIDELKAAFAESREKEDFMRFQLGELSGAGLKVGEQEELEQEQEAATHTEEIKSALYDADNMLSGEGGALEILRQANSRTASVSAFHSSIGELAERLDSSLIELRDIAKEISREAEGIDFNPERLARINERLDFIYTLQRKYHKDSIGELLEEQNRLQDIIDGIDNSDDIIREKEDLLQKLADKAAQFAARLSATRKKAVKEVEKEICQRLAALGMPNVDFKVEMEQIEPGTSGQDKVSFLFSANKGMALRPVSQVASGGEIARLMLSLKALISTTVKLPTIIFDEIDTGVSGKIAEKMAGIMKDMGDCGRQVISITHLPQIAAMGTYHYKVEKHDTPQHTNTVMRRLADDERIGEIAQMLSGSDISEAALSNAKALLWK